MNWDLTYLFATKEDFNKALSNFPSYIEKLASFKGKLGNEKDLVEFLIISRDTEETLGRIYQYASLSSDLNKKDVEALAVLNQVRFQLNNYMQAVSYAEPEVLALGSDYAMQVINNNEEVKEYKFIYEKLFHQNEHVLSEKEEALLSAHNALYQAGSELYSSLMVGDAESKDVTLTSGEHVKVSANNYTSLLAGSEKQEDRKLIFEAMFSNYESKKNALANIYKVVLDKDIVTAKCRNYPNSLEAHLFRNNIPTSVYYNLMDVASSCSEPVRKYYNLLEKHFNLECYHTYDRFLNLATSEKKYTYEEAKEIFFDSIKKFPEDFKEKAKEVLRDGFVDVNIKDGKRSGAYSSGQANLHPFILLNFDNTLDSVFTLAHESGHSIHTMYSMENQPTVLQDYTIFVAEIASTFNEHNLLDYFVTSGNATKEEKIMVVQKAINEIISTFIRQTLFAEYELKAHELAANGEAINYEVLSNIMKELYMKYYQVDLNKEELSKYVWCYIPHLFYTPFYVYQYATSYSASFKLYQDVKDNVPNAFNKYIGLLSSGGSKYPMDQVKEAGVDFTKKETFMAVKNRLVELVDELEELLK